MGSGPKFANFVTKQTQPEQYRKAQRVGMLQGIPSSRKGKPAPTPVPSPRPGVETFEQELKKRRANSLGGSQGGYGGTTKLG